MFEYIYRLQQKPEHIRRRIVLIVSISVTAVIALVWISIVGLRFSGEGTASYESADTPSPFALFGDKIIGLYETARDAVSNLKK